MMLLTGCQTKVNNTVPSIILPEFPVIPIETNKELKTAFNPVCVKLQEYIGKTKEAEYLTAELNTICSPKSKYTKEWLDELYKFKVRYYIYEDGLK